MLFKDLLKNVDIEKALEALINIYPEEKTNIEKYKTVYNTLLNLNPTITFITIDISEYVEEITNEQSYNVSGFRDCEYFSLDMNDWSEWLHYEVNVEQLQQLSPELYLGLCLYEITFNGFTNEERESNISELNNIIYD